MLNPSRAKTLAPRLLDILALIGWAALLFKYWLSGQLYLLIHPNYFGLVLVTSIVLFILGCFQIRTLLQQWKLDSGFIAPDNSQHITLLPKNLGTGLLLLAAIAGLLIAPRPLTSQIALQRGISESLPVTRVQARSFQATTKPEDKTLIDWVRTLNAYPEPDAYTGQPAKVTGFVVHLPQLPENYLLISRFILTCCAVDAYPVGLPVKLPSGSRDSYPPDTWLEIQGEMFTETLPIEAGKSETRRQLAIAARTITPIPTPSDPYAY
jgi:uncharacterized repeat protein (TIGR03943 family)